MLRSNDKQSEESVLKRKRKNYGENGLWKRKKRKALSLE